VWISIDLHDVCGRRHPTRSNAFSEHDLLEMASGKIRGARDASTSMNFLGPVRAVIGALIPTNAEAAPVVLVGGLGGGRAHRPIGVAMGGETMLGVAPAVSALWSFVAILALGAAAGGPQSP
jgi:hypothetical protein